MNTGNIACKLIDMLHLLRPSTGMIHGLGHRTDFLPLVISKGCWMQSPKALILVLDNSPIITWSIGGIKLIPKHGRHGILGKESGPKSLTAGAIACLIQRISDFVSLDPFHTEFAKQTQAWVLLGIKLRRRFRTCRM